MAQASASIDIPASPSDVWQLIGGFNSQDGKGEECIIVESGELAGTGAQSYTV